MKIRRIRVSKYKSAQFAKLFFFFLDENNKEQKVYISFKCKLYLLKNLRADILIKNNILVPESFILNVGLGHAIMESYTVKITIRTR